MNLRAYRLLLLSAVLAASPALAADEPLEPYAVDGTPVVWTANYAAALKQAQAEKRFVLLNFTGSDWCVWCHRLRDQVFVQKPFLDYAAKHLVLVEVDFPRAKPQSDETKKQNAALDEKFGVSGYPTVILVDAEGRELGRTGYMQGGAKTFVRALKRFAAKAATPE